MKLKKMFLWGIMIALIVAIPAPQPGRAQGGYEQLVRRALSELDTNCANLDPNSVCYGFAEVSATFSDAFPTAALAAPGDRAELTGLLSLRTSAINLGAGTWGVAVMNVQANVPAALASESAVFLLVGDVEVTNEVDPADALLPLNIVPVRLTAMTNVFRTPGAGGQVLGRLAAGTELQADGISPDGTWLRVMYNRQVAWIPRANTNTDAPLEGLPVITRESLTPMQAFTFRTGGSVPPSLVVPPHVLVVQSPRGVPVDIIANEVPIRVDGVVFLRTLPDGRFQLIASDGEARAYPDAPNQVRVLAGTSVILGGGTWTEWGVLSQGEWDSYGSLELITNVWTYQLVLPNVIKPSGVGQPPEIIEIPGGIIIPIPPRPPVFPVVPVTFGEPGTELERLAWEPITIGCGVCRPQDAFYHSDSDGDWDIYRLAENGLNSLANNITRGNGSQDVQPSYSADGEWVAFTTNRDILGGWEIYLAKPDGSQQVRLTYNTANDVNPVWGPAHLIAWESNRNGNWELYMADVSTDGLPVRLTDDPANDINPFWLPDGGCGQPEGGRLVFQSDRDGDWEIFLLDVISGELTQLTDNDTEDIVPALSRDGSTLAWLQLNDFGVYDLWVMDMVTQEARRLVDLGTDVAGHTFAPDGASLAFFANADGDADVFLTDVATGQITPLTTNSFEDRAPSFTCDGTAVVFHSDAAADEANPGQRDLFSVRLSTPIGPAVRLTQDAQADDLYPIADPHEEINSKEGRMPPHP